MAALWLLEVHLAHLWASERLLYRLLVLVERHLLKVHLAHLRAVERLPHRLLVLVERHLPDGPREFIGPEKIILQL